MKFRYDNQGLLRLILNARFPNHNITKMMAEATITSSDDGVEVMVTDDIVKSTAPGAGKEFPWS